MLAVHVLVQAIVIAGPIAQQERRRPRLTGLPAAREVRLVLARIADGNAHRFVPPVRDWGEPRIETATKRANLLRQRIGEIFVLAPAKAMFRHHDAGAKAGVAGIERRKFATGLRRDELRRHSATVSVEIALDRGPVERDKTLIRPAIAGHLLPKGEGSGGAACPLSLGERGRGEGLLRESVCREDLLEKRRRGSRLHHAASRSMSLRLRSTPQR